MRVDTGQIGLSVSEDMKHYISVHCVYELAVLIYYYFYLYYYLWTFV